MVWILYQLESLCFDDCTGDAAAEAASGAGGAAAEGSDESRVPAQRPRESVTRPERKCGLFS